MDLLLPVAKITPDSGEPQQIRMSHETMRALGVRERDPVLIIHGQHLTQAGAIVGPPLPSPETQVVLDVITRYALGALEGHRVRVVKSKIESGTSITVIPRRRWKMPVEEGDFRHVLLDRLVAPRQRIPLINRGIWLDFQVASVVPDTQIVRVTPDTRIIVNPAIEKISTSNIARNAASRRGDNDAPPELDLRTEMLPDPVLDATDLIPENNRPPQVLIPNRNPLHPPRLQVPSPAQNFNPKKISRETRKYYQESWGFDPVAVLKRDGLGSFYFESEIPLVNDNHLVEAGVTMYAHTQIPTPSFGHVFEWNMNNIVFRCGSQEGRASCVHTILQKGSLEDAFRLTDAVARGAAFPRPGSLADLDPLEHFAALRSYCHAIAEMGILHGIESTINYEDTGIRGELAFGFNSNLQGQIMNALLTVAPDAVSRQLREVILWSLDKAPGDWLQGPGGKLFARRMFLANTLLKDPDLAPHILQVLRTKGVPLPEEGDDQQKVATFFGLTGHHGNRPNREMQDEIMQELRDMFGRRVRPGDIANRREELLRRLQERLNNRRDRVNRDGPAPPPPPPRTPPSSSPPTPPEKGNKKRSKPDGPRRWDEDDLNFFAV